MLYGIFFSNKCLRPADNDDVHVENAFNFCEFYCTTSDIE